jgi:predicted lipoprotein with Yx(FWY)xxD motif
MSTYYFWRYFSRNFSSTFVTASLVTSMVLSSAWGQSVPVPSNPIAPAPAEATTQLRVRNSAYGLTLTDALGRTLYLFEGDTSPDASLCAGACATIWIPMALQAGQAGPLPMAGSIAIQQNLINGFVRTDGLFQVTYNGHPLYYYLGDGGSATTTYGEGINQFGSFWYLVGPSGSALTIPVVQ